MVGKPPWRGDRRLPHAHGQSPRLAFAGTTLAPRAGTAAATMGVVHHGGNPEILSRNHVTRRPVRQAVKITRNALNHALDVAEPRLERAARALAQRTRPRLKAR